MERRKVLILICIFIIGIIIVGLGIGYYIFDNKDKQIETDIKKALEQELRLTNKTVEYGTEINLLDENKIAKDNEKIVTKIYIGDTEVTTYKFDEIGKVEFTEVTYTYYTTFLNQEKRVEVKRISTYTVEDTKNPIIEGVSDKTITIGDNIDLKEGITARDEIDGNIEIITEGDVDTNTAGEYNVKVIAKDKNGNITEETYVVKVNNKLEEKQEINTNKATENNSSKNSISTNSSNNSQSVNKNTQEEQTTYNYETYGNKIYFEEDRGTNGNYSEKFTW